MSTRRSLRSPLTAVALCTASVLAVAGCGSSDNGTVTPSQSATPTTAAPTTAAPTTTAPTAPPTTTAPTAPPSTLAPTAPPTTPVVPAQFCRLSELSVTAGQGGGAAGTIYGTLLFRNTGQRTCELSGYPGVAGLDAAGQQVTQAVRVPGTDVAVTLAPGAVASASVSGTDVPVGNQTACGTYASLLVTPPGDTRSTVVSLSLPACSGLKIRPVVAGTTGT